MSGGNGDAMEMDFEAFVAQTQILISNAVGFEDDLVPSASVELFPNLSKDKVFLKGKDISNELDQIFNILGKLASEVVVQGNKIQFIHLRLESILSPSQNSEFVRKLLKIRTFGVYGLLL